MKYCSFCQTEIIDGKYFERIKRCKRCHNKKQRDDRIKRTCRPPIIDIENEVWVQCVDHNVNYCVSNMGRIKNIVCDRILKGNTSSKGYKVCKFSLNGEDMGIAIHRLVAYYFHGKPKINQQINHKDGNKLNNRVDNLEWVTCAENIRHAIDNNLRRPLFGAESTNSVFTNEQVYAIRLMYLLNKATIKEMCEIFSVTKSCVWNVIKNKTYTINDLL